MVEFAIIIPLFLLLVSGVVDFGLGLNASITITNAAREAARLGVVKPYSDQIVARAQSMAVGLNVANMTVAAGCERGGVLGACTLGTGATAGTAASGDTVKVTVSYDYPMIWPIAFGTIVHLSQTSDFRIE
jgi:Flp pilus assembly protein TadG